MTHVLFLHGVGDCHRAAVVWLARQLAIGRKIHVVLSDNIEVERFDQLLWTHRPIGFLPHCLSESSLATQTPIVLGVNGALTHHDDCMLNLSNQLPEGFSRFQQLVEVISKEEGHKVAGRDRFRRYRELGYAIDSENFAEGIHG